MNYLSSTPKQWFEKSLAEQLSNVGAEISRAINWQKTDQIRSKESFIRGIELLDLTIEDPKNKGSALKELCRLKEVLGDYFLGSNKHGSNATLWDSYFYFFNIIVSEKYF